MVRQLRPAHVFLTLSAAETRWVHLLKVLSTLVDNVSLSDDDVTAMSCLTKCQF